MVTSLGSDLFWFRLAPYLYCFIENGKAQGGGEEEGVGAAGVKFHMFKMLPPLLFFGAVSSRSHDKPLMADCLSNDVFSGADPLDFSWG